MGEPDKTVALYRIVADRLSIEELRTAAFELGIDYDSLPGEGKAARSRELVLFLSRRGRLDHLMHWLKTNRPDIDVGAFAQDDTARETPLAHPAVRQPFKPSFISVVAMVGVIVATLSALLWFRGNSTALSSLTTTPGASPKDESRPSSATRTVLLHSSLDDIASITTPRIGGGGTTTLAPEDFVEAKVGKGAHLTRSGRGCSAQDGQVILFPVMAGGKENIALDQGEIEFWYQPDYPASDVRTQRQLMSVTVDGYNPPFFTLTMLNEMQWGFQDAGWNTFSTTTEHGRISWQAGEWVHIRATWDNSHATDSLQLFLNDKRVDQRHVAGGWTFGPTDERLKIIPGALTPCGDAIAEGVIDELVIRR